jgi:hypothetical protein
MQRRKELAFTGRCPYVLVGSALPHIDPAQRRALADRLQIYDIPVSPSKSPRVITQTIVEFVCCVCQTSSGKARHRKDCNKPLAWLLRDIANALIKDHSEFTGSYILETLRFMRLLKRETALIEGNAQRSWKNNAFMISVLRRIMCEKPKFPKMHEMGRAACNNDRLSEKKRGPNDMPLMYLVQRIAL